MYLALYRWPVFVALAYALCLGVVQAGDAQTVRVGVLKFGTVNWELDVIERHGLAQRHGIRLEAVPLASKSSTHVAIQGGAVDVIVTDWVWVSRQRSEGRDYAFAPYSTAAGNLMVNPDAGITSLETLAGKRIGVAGGPVDKSWLLLRAYARKALDGDLAELAQPTYAAPPLLNELALRGELPAVLNFWHYSARLEAAGFHRLLTVEELLNKIGVAEPMPLIGWAFRESWANANEAALQGLLDASAAAKQIMLESDAEWERLRPLLKAPDEKTERALRDAFREGIASCFDQGVIDAAGRVFGILAAEGGRELTGAGDTLSEGTFWTRLRFTPCRG